MTFGPALSDSRRIDINNSWLQVISHIQLIHKQEVSRQLNTVCSMKRSIRCLKNVNIVEYFYGSELKARPCPVFI